MADAPEEEGRRIHLNTVNAVWGQQDYEFLAPFLDVLAENYGAGVRPVDFKDKDAREESRLTINDWVADQTEDRIKDLVPPDSFNALTRLVLTNAIYFNAMWSKPFDEAAPMSFHRLDGRTANVPMMAGSTRNYGSGDGYQAVSVPYRNRRVSMTIILPELESSKRSNRRWTLNVRVRFWKVSDLSKAALNSPCRSSSSTRDSSWPRP